MKKILIATPIYPPSSGGPATHSKKLKEYFGERAKIFVFERYNFFPFGVRHFVAAVIIFFKSIFQVKIIFALDGFSIAMPSVLVARILRIPVVLRIGGDLVHEQYVESGNMLPMNEFYEKYKKGELDLSIGMKIKMFAQQIVVKFSDGIIFNTLWQKNMYEENYRLPKNIWVLNNPIEKFEGVVARKNPEDFFVLSSIVRHVPFKNLDLIQKVVDEINQQKLLPKKIFFETKNAPHKETMEKIAGSDAYIAGAISDIAPNQLLEALSLGIPSICTKNTGYYNLLKDEKFVIFVDPKSKEEIKDAILKILNPEMNFKMREGLANFKWQYSWEDYFKEYERITEHFCSNNQ